jgi:hypothetical protein
VLGRDRPGGVVFGTEVVMSELASGLLPSDVDSSLSLSFELDTVVVREKNFDRLSKLAHFCGKGNLEAGQLFNVLVFFIATS